MNHAVHLSRRLRFGLELGEGVLALIPGASLVTRNDDVHFPFRQDSDFLYLTGWNEPGALLIIVGGREPRSILFSLPKNQLKELWEGERIGQAKALSEFGFDETHSIERHEEMETLIQRLLSECRMVAYSRQKISLVSPFITIHESKMKRKLPVVDAHRILGEMRLIKDSSEIALMKRAGVISGSAHRDLLRFVKPGRYEYEVEAELIHSFRRAGGESLPAYSPIVGGGVNACTLHYVKNNARLQDGDLLLVDAGCEVLGYASDITRTIPIRGLWIHPQRVLYEIVLRAQVEAIRRALVGVPLGYLHEVSRRKIIYGLLQIGLIKARDEEDAFLRGLDKEFFPHGTSHWLGLDVHDSGDYQFRDETRWSERRLEAGMVITVEPGIYVRSSPDIPPPFRNIGIRIEDDVLITEAGPVILSHLAPKDPEEIESIMQCGMS